MIFYDANDWSVLNILRYRGSVVPHACLWAFTSAALEATFRHTGFCQYYLVEIIDITRDGGSLTVVWGGFTAVLSMLLAARNSQSYRRFWEGARLVYMVRGEWFNCVSSLLSFCSVDPMKDAEVKHFQQILVRLASLLHGMALQHVCDVAEDSLEVLDMEGFDESSLEYLETVHDRCDVLIQWLQRLMVGARRKGIVDVPDPILTRSFQELSRGIVNLNNVRRIKDIPFPYPYHQIALLLLMVHWFVTPLLACLYINSAVLSTALVFTGQAGMWAVVFVANQMDQPFGEDANDLPMAEMQQDFNRSLISLLHPLSQHVPDYDPNAQVSSAEDARSKRKHKTLNVNGGPSPSGSMLMGSFSDIGDDDEIHVADLTNGSVQDGCLLHADNLLTEVDSKLEDSSLANIPQSRRPTPLSPKGSTVFWSNGSPDVAVLDAVPGVAADAPADAPAIADVATDATPAAAAAAPANVTAPAPVFRRDDSGLSGLTTGSDRSQTSIKFGAQPVRPKARKLEPLAKKGRGISGESQASVQQGTTKLAPKVRTLSPAPIHVPPPEVKRTSLSQRAGLRTSISRMRV
eukprot:TRINITY_DN31719_c0_g1_i2.p1 TRINITY_DN31719_c0_g1~~TRINITY_DN31719_c0_g1_i2.p1  ORF type:complete len:575 (+),score=100.76 TRINITY_DN31719_c0_g1_i2:43-1767(+)